MDSTPGILTIVMAVVGTAISFSALIVAGIRVFRPIIEKKRERCALIEAFGKGPFDKETIEKSTRYFIPSKCSNIDPAQEMEIRHALTAVSKDMFKVVNEFIFLETPIRYLLILADSGMGKTTFVLNYYAQYVRKNRRNKIKLAVVPLGHKDPDKYIAKVPEQDREDTVIFLDAFDEDTGAISDYLKRLSSLMDACCEFRRVIITCRTQFFKRDEEIPVDTGIVRIGPRGGGVGGNHEFRKIYLSPFDDSDVARFLKKRYPFWQSKTREKAFEIAKKIPNLKVRPMLLAHIPDIISKGQQISKTYQLYDLMIESWFEREEGWLNKENLKEFSERMAMDLFVNREERGMEKASHDEIVGLAEKWSIPLESWQLTGRSLLNRDAEGNYKFAHRSIMEYLYVRRFIAIPEEERPGLEIEWTDQMKAFLLEMMEDGSAGTNLAKVDLRGVNVSHIDLRIFNLSWAKITWINFEVDMEFVCIQPGTFQMGSPDDESERRSDETLHEVILTKGYYMQTTQVTQKQWCGVMGNNPSYFKKDGDQCPVEKVSWDDVQDFIKKLNQMEGKGVYRLPTEAEWEYACRAGTMTPFYFGKCLYADQANYNGTEPMPGCPKGEYREKTVPVGSLQPNAWGLYDMHGNVQEWCQDRYGNYPEGSVTNPVGPGFGEPRVMRGGGWNYDGRNVRSAYRHGYETGLRWSNHGFRLARSHKSPGLA